MRLSPRLALPAIVALSLSTAARADEVCNNIGHQELEVDGRNDEWTNAEVKVQPGDIVLVFARGKVKLGGWMGEVGPNGQNNGLGRLHIKVGTGTVVPIGERWVGTFREGGTVKFKIHDTNYQDNEGKFLVHLLILPRSALPPAVHVDSD
jgi:hypothetical protein